MQKNILDVDIMADKDKFAHEILTDEQLDGVAGGNNHETNSDLTRFESIGIKIFKDCGNDISATYNSTLNNLIKAFQQFGVKCKLDFCCESNQYFVDGKEISREEAWNHIYSQIGK